MPESRPIRARLSVALVAALAALCLLGAPAGAGAAVRSQEGAAVTRSAAPEAGSGSLESAAARAGSIGRAVAMSLIGLALAVAATVLAFKRDFKEAAGVLAVGIVAVLLATPSGVSLLRDTVASLFGK